MRAAEDLNVGEKMSKDIVGNSTATIPVSGLIAKQRKAITEQTNR